MDIDIHQQARGKKRKFLVQSQGKGGKPARQLAMSNQQMIKNAVIKAGETKYFDTLVAFAAIFNGVAGMSAVGAGCLTPAGGMANPVAGALSNNRVGKAIFLQSIKVRLIYQLPQQAIIATGQSPLQIRILIVRDKEPQGAALPAVGNIITDTATANNLTNFQDPTLMGRWVVYYDKLHILQDPNSATASNGRTASIKKTIKFNGLRVRFTDTTSVPVTDQFHVFCYATTAVGAPIVGGTLRATYKDE